MGPGPEQIRAEVVRIEDEKVLATVHASTQTTSTADFIELVESLLGQIARPRLLTDPPVPQESPRGA